MQNTILEHVTKAQNLHNMLKSLYLSTFVQQKDGDSAQLLSGLLSSMKALLDSTQLDGLDAAVNEIKEKILMSAMQLKLNIS